jgi:PKD repeat protein
MKRTLFAVVFIVLFIGVVSADTVITFPYATGYAINSTNQSLSSMRSAPGQTANVAAATINWYESGSMASGCVTANRRGIVSYNTSFAYNGIPTGSTITGASVNLFAYFRYGTNLFPDASIVNCFPSTASVIASDYRRTNFIKLGPDIPFASSVAGQWANFTITNLSYISQTGNTSFMLVNSFEADNNLTAWYGGDWGFVSNSSRAGTNIPSMTMTYTTGSPPTASFTASPVSGTAPLSVQFNDTSTNTPTSWGWFLTNVTPGNNTLSQFSILQDPVHIFGVGNFTIKLNATNAYGSNVSIQDTWVNVTDVASTPLPIASFFANNLSFCAGNSTQFNDTSEYDITNWLWDFGEGNTSIIQNASHIYNVIGSHTVSLTVTNASGIDAEVKPGYITVSSCAPVTPTSAGPGILGMMLSTFNLMIGVMILLIFGSIGMHVLYSTYGNVGSLYTHIAAMFIAGLLSAYLAVMASNGAIYEVVGSTQVTVSTPSLGYFLLFISIIAFGYTLFMSYGIISNALQERKTMTAQKNEEDGY